MAKNYATASLDAAGTNGKPGTRWELADALGLSEYNYNVAVLGAGERLSENAYHYHEDQSELFHMVERRCRVGTECDSFDLGADEITHFEPGATHLLHNAFDAACRLVVVGAPADGRYPVEQVQSHDALLAERYPDENLADPSAEVGR